MYSENELDLVLKERKPMRGWEHLDEEYLATIPNLSGVTLKGHFYRTTRLAGANLCSATLEGDFSDVDFTDAILVKANLSGTNLQKSGFGRANLREANLSLAQAVGADFESACLSHGELLGIVATSCDFSLADLGDADMTVGCFVKARFISANLEEAQLRGALLVGANLTDAGLKDAGLREADLSGCDFTGANLEGAATQGAIASFSTSFLGARMPNGERYRERDESPQETLHRYRVPELDE